MWGHANGDGNRVKKTEGGETILYVNKYFQKNLTTGEATSFYYSGGRLTATYNGTDLRYIHQDHLTGTSVVTDSNGDPVSGIKYMPYGETRSSSRTLPSQKFTGQRLDETGLYFYNARYYDATIGRFISADTIVPDYANPQAFNRYAYVLNNPLRYIDPSGYLSGTVGIDGETYTIIEDSGGDHHLVADDGSESGSVGLDVLMEILSGQMEQIGYYGHGGNEDEGATVRVMADGPYGTTMPIYFVPENASIANELRLMGYGGKSYADGLTVLRREIYNNQPGRMTITADHELYHAWERLIMGDTWFEFNYKVSQQVAGNIYDFNGLDYFEGVHNVTPSEMNAREYSGDPRNRYPVAPFKPWIQKMFDSLNVFK